MVVADFGRYQPECQENQSRDNDYVIKVPDHREEIGNQIKRQRQIRQCGPEQASGEPGRSRVTAEGGVKGEMPAE
jgi:hypothetical protein